MSMLTFIFTCQYVVRMLLFLGAILYSHSVLVVYSNVERPINLDDVCCFGKCSCSLWMVPMKIIGQLQAIYITWYRI